MCSLTPFQQAKNEIHAVRWGQNWTHTGLFTPSPMAPQGPLLQPQCASLPLPDPQQPKTPAPESLQGGVLEQRGPGDKSPPPSTTLGFPCRSQRRNVWAELQTGVQTTEPLPQGPRAEPQLILVPVVERRPVLSQHPVCPARAWRAGSQPLSPTPSPGELRTGPISQPSHAPCVGVCLSILGIHFSTRDPGD